MRTDDDHRHGPGETGLGQHLGAQRAGGVAGCPQRREEGEVDPQTPGDGGGPVAGAGVDQLGGGGVGDLRPGPAGQPVTDQIGDHQHLPSSGELGSSVCRDQLVDGVERQILEPCRRIQLAGRQDGRDLLRHSLRTVVPVVDRIAEELAGRVEESVVDGPAVDADAREASARRGGRGAQAVEHTPVEGEDVPVQGGTGPDRPVGEPVDLGQLQYARAGAAQHHPPARRTEVDGGESEGVGHVHLLPTGCRRFQAGCRVGCGVPDCRHREPLGQRRKAAATPASTGMCSPVVCERSPPVSAKTALATCSGSTSRFSSVRRA